MTLKWITPAGEIVNDNEEQVIKDVNIEFEPYDASLTMISGELPEGVTLDKVQDGCYTLNGVLPLVNNQSEYHFTLRISQGEDFSDRYFTIIIQNKALVWADEQEDTLEMLETTYVSHQLQLKNANGNEQFIKLSGQLPKGLAINSNGLIYGTVDKLVGETDEEYSCKIGVVGYPNLTKTFTFIVKKVSSMSDPIWITETGDLGNVNFNQQSKLLVKAYDINGRPISYRLKSGTLPTGLSLNISNGRIEGVLISKQTHEWDFNIVVDNGLKEVSREFSIRTNSVLDEDDIKWISEGVIGQCPIGKDVSILLETESNHKVRYKLISNTLPKGLTLSLDGKISGRVTYQEMKDYSFIVEASNGYKSVQTELKINVCKGLGYNALQCYYYINHENDDEYNNLIATFDASSAYQTTNDLLKVSPYPEIDICTLTCFDKTLIAHMFEMNTPIDMTWGKTIKQDYIENEEIIYSAFYKSMKEEPISATNTIRDWLTQPLYVQKYEYNNVLYDTSTQTIVDKDHEYPQYVLKWDSKADEYYVEYNGERKYVDVYTYDENGNKQAVYTKVQNETWHKDIDYEKHEDEYEYDLGTSETIDFTKIIDANTEEQYTLYPVKMFVEYLNTEVDYKQYLVYEKGTNNLQEGIIFTLDWNPLTKFVIQDGIVCHISTIDKPWIFEPLSNESFTFKDTIVLPYITDEDVHDIDTDKPYIQFFNKDDEVLPSWKSHYFPSLNLFYSKPGTNVQVLNSLNNSGKTGIEDKGGFWTGRKFVFYEVHFKPMYNSNIDNFAITFYNHKDNKTPPFQLI